MINVYIYRKLAPGPPPPLKILDPSQPSICVATSQAPKQSTETMADHHHTAQAYT